MLMCPVQAWSTIQRGNTSCSRPATTSTSPSSSVRDDSCPGLTTGGPSWTAKGNEDLKKKKPPQRPGQLTIWTDELMFFTSTSSSHSVFLPQEGSVSPWVDLCWHSFIKGKYLHGRQIKKKTSASCFDYMCKRLSFCFAKCGHLKPVLFLRHWSVFFLQPSPQKASCINVSMHCDSTSGRTTTQRHEQK